MDLRTILSANDGVITLAQAASVGLDRSAVRRRVSSGEWRHVGRGVYFAADRRLTDRARTRIKRADIGDRAVVSGASAAWWFRMLDRAPKPVTVCVPRGRHGAAREGVLVIHRDLDPVDVVSVDGLVVVSRPLAAIEAAVTHGAGVLDNALLRHLVTLDDVAAAHDRYPSRRGSPRAAAIIEACAGGARSHAERIAHRLLDGASITGWTANDEASGYAGDLLFADARLIVEIDGFAFHSAADDFQRDRTRQNALVAAGWTVLRFTWADLTERPDHVLAVIRHALRRAA
ncbi:MAG: type IV toxin-antitoxin system AbiEi family antitoxin domain-containing protein [Gordonia paraffinivorans]